MPAVINDLQARNYVLYLASMGDRPAFKRVEAAMAAVLDPKVVSDFSIALHVWKVPDRGMIYLQYVDDGRATSDVNGKPGLRVADYPRIYLSMPPYDGPVQHLDKNGQPIR